MIGNQDHNKIHVTRAEYAEHAEHVKNRDGVCIACRDWTATDVPNRGRRFHCPVCRTPTVWGAQEIVASSWVVWLDSAPTMAATQDEEPATADVVHDVRALLARIRELEIEVRFYEAERNAVRDMRSGDPLPVVHARALLTLHAEAVSEGIVIGKAQLAAEIEPQLHELKAMALADRQELAEVKAAFTKELDELRALALHGGPDEPGSN